MNNLIGPLNKVFIVFVLSRGWAWEKNREDVCFTWWVNNQTVVACVTLWGDWIRLLQ